MKKALAFGAGVGAGHFGGEWLAAQLGVPPSVGMDLGEWIQIGLSIFLIFVFLWMLSFVG
jgi:hypothetical protein